MKIHVTETELNIWHEIYYLLHKLMLKNKYWSSNVIFMKFSALAAPGAVILTTSVVASDENFN